MQRKDRAVSDSKALKVVILMGSKSDWEVMKAGGLLLESDTE